MSEESNFANDCAKKEKSGVYFAKKKLDRNSVVSSFFRQEKWKGGEDDE